MVQNVSRGSNKIEFLLTKLKRALISLQKLEFSRERLLAIANNSTRFTAIQTHVMAIK